MKYTILILSVSILSITISFPQQESRLTANELTEENLLDFYRQYSEFTDPGEYAYMYNNLPESLPELCRLIRSQFIHPYTELQNYSEQIPEERWNEATKYPTVNSILKGLSSLDSAGLIFERKPEDRLILICRHNAILLASILKYRGIPARVRAGYAAYLAPGYHINHAICEVWNEKENRWMLVDPSMDMVDFSKDKFDFGNDTWLKLQNNAIDPDLYGNPGRQTGLVSILAVVCSDITYLLGTEYTIYQYAQILVSVFEKDKQLKTEQIELFNKISKLMTTPDAKNLSKLQDIYNKTPDIQITKSFLDEISKNDVDENKTNENNLSIDKPNIEFTDIPGGTFTMGSPIDEAGREDDEVQHEVTVSPFKMSKYTVTVEQYNMFCKATGRKRMWYGPNGKADFSVTQVTWYNAQAFAEWMGCRLPTEAEFEYAARANTTTAFYTGDCITTDEANFDGKKSYSTCEKGENRKKPVSVGSFAPNAFGLYDMHGNMLEWCSDWYGEYNIEDKQNPQGPETGGRKVARGGGFWASAQECRSAKRDAVPAENRGAGISFRLVKDE